MANDFKLFYEHINFQFGHDRQFIGDGYRSMLMSDFSPPALFLKINTNVWRLNYTNLFTQIFADALKERPQRPFDLRDWCHAFS